jgi:hypothetical protein
MAFRGLSTTARRKGGRLILTKTAEYMLNYSRTAHILLVTGAIPLAVAEVRAEPKIRLARLRSGYQIARL